MDDVTKAQLDYAWKWFDLHAKQRTALFNYFMIIIGILANASVVSYKEGYAIVAATIAVLGALTSLAFIMFDVRNRELVAESEAVLEKLEDDHLFPATFVGAANNRLGLLAVERRTRMREGEARSIVANLKKHKLWIRGLEAAVGLCFVASLFVLPHQRIPPADRTNEELQQLRVLIQETPTNGDLKTIRDHLSRLDDSVARSASDAELRALREVVTRHEDILVRIRAAVEKGRSGPPR